jgi:hypothetical protein
VIRSVRRFSRTSVPWGKTPVHQQCHNDSVQGAPCRIRSGLARRITSAICASISSNTPIPQHKKPSSISRHGKRPDHCPSLTTCATATHKGIRAGSPPPMPLLHRVSPPVPRPLTSLRVVEMQLAAGAARDESPLVRPTPIGGSTGAGRSITVRSDNNHEFSFQRTSASQLSIAKH